MNFPPTTPTQQAFGSPAATFTNSATTQQAFGTPAATFTNNATMQQAFGTPAATFTNSATTQQAFGTPAATFTNSATTQQAFRPPAAAFTNTNGATPATKTPSLVPPSSAKRDRSGDHTLVQAQQIAQSIRDGKAWYYLDPASKQNHQTRKNKGYERFTTGDSLDFPIPEDENTIVYLHRNGLVVVTKTEDGDKHIAQHDCVRCLDMFWELNSAVFATMNATEISNQAFHLGDDDREKWMSGLFAMSAPRLLGDVTYQGRVKSFLVEVATAFKANVAGDKIVKLAHVMIRDQKARSAACSGTSSTKPLEQALNMTKTVHENYHEYSMANLNAQHAQAMADKKIQLEQAKGQTQLYQLLSARKKRRSHRSEESDESSSDDSEHSEDRKQSSKKRRRIRARIPSRSNDTAADAASSAGGVGPIPPPGEIDPDL